LKIRFMMHDVYGQGGGVLTVVRNLAAELAKWHEVEIASVLRSREEPVHAFPPGVAVTPLTEEGRDQPGARRPSTLIPDSEPRYARFSAYSDERLRAYLDGLRDGVVIGMQPGVNVAIARAAPDSVGRIGQDHVPFKLRGPELKEAMRTSIPRLDSFLTLTATDAKLYRKLLGRKMRIRAIPNAAPDFHGPLSDHSQKVVTAAGRLEALKGFDRLVEAWQLVHRRHPDWELRIFGVGSQEEALRQQIRELGLEGSARLMGYSNTLPAELAQSSIFALSSRFEAYGMVMVEAMAAGVPAVAFDCPTGPRDIITNGVDGFLVPNRKTQAFANALVRLIEMGEDRIAMGRAARRTAESLNQETIARRWEEEIAWVDAQAEKRR
jgi:glycosyltransferase involved in cell wall biosynthesis